MVFDRSFSSSLVPARDYISRFSDHLRPRLSLKTGKRFFDFTLASVSILVLSPVLVMVALALLIVSGGPIFFRHRRIGKGGKSFFCLKFRTMRTDADGMLSRLLQNDASAREEWESTRKLRSDPRVTRFGAALRKSSIDELPQLINILRGEMSFVGPRPIVEAEKEQYGLLFEHYKAVRPGLTGMWQISGRSEICFSSRVSLDCAYVQHHSMMLDLLIIVKTFPAVWRARGSY